MRRAGAHAERTSLVVSLSRLRVCCDEVKRARRGAVERENCALLWVRDTPHRDRRRTTARVPGTPDATGGWVLTRDGRGRSDPCTRSGDARNRRHPAAGSTPRPPRPQTGRDDHGLGRERTSSLRSTFLTCERTVSTDTTRRSAISSVKGPGTRGRGPPTHERSAGSGSAAGRRCRPNQAQILDQPHGQPTRDHRPRRSARSRGPAAGLSIPMFLQRNPKAPAPGVM